MHKRVLITLFLLLSSLLANAQLKVAILPAADKTGEVKYAVKMLLTGSLTTAISETEGYEAYDRIDLGAVLDEHAFQRTGMVSDSEIRKIGEMTGANYVLVTEASPMDETCMVATAKIVNVESARIENSAVAIISVNPRQMVLDCKQLTNKLLRVDAQRSASSVLQTKPLFVDLGLSVKWATCNLGASEPEGLGSLFAWGETSPKWIFSWSTYKWWNGKFTKYNGEDHIDRLLNVDDAAAMQWGDQWRSPTYSDVQELIKNCTFSMVERNRVRGVLVISRYNNHSFFIPDATYWTSNSNLGLADRAFLLESEYATKCKRFFEKQGVWPLHMRELLKKELFEIITIIDEFYEGVEKEVGPAIAVKPAQEIMRESGKKLKFYLEHGSNWSPEIRLSRERDSRT